ncbi:MAG: hypothetical protein ABI782_00555 [Anaerolineaceae bacterium]
MKVRTALSLAAAALPFLAFATAAADDGDTATLARASLGVGEQVALRLEVNTTVGETVEVNPGGAQWNGIEVVRVTGTTSRRVGDRAVHMIDLVVAAFAPGKAPFQPVVSIVNGSEVAPRVLPVLTLNVLSSLGPNDKLELSPLAPPAEIEGAESRLLKPAIALGAVGSLLAFSGALFWTARAFSRRPKRVIVEPPPVAAPPTLTGAEGIIDVDPVGAYRTLSSVVRGALGARYGFPASSLTTPELKRRMESAGVDRWQARLVGGLLEECDAVVYAGYRPAGERRNADLNIAREIVEGVS